ncbi:MAG: polysaccharide deacetylase family protein [Clostridia bacterium]|nr:polysaccharide deacetylase family protein [Clostridia bacterium]NCD02454.1 polysaccharide deacetylase family protein [Clostridia bacterium]
MKSFLKIGCILCSCFLLYGLFTSCFGPDIVITTSASHADLCIRSVSTNKPQISLTFDTGCGPDNTSELLKILKSRQILASFFITGEWASRYPELLQQIAADGHDLGNHSETHQNMNQLSEEECLQELMTLHHRIKSLTDIDMNLFRPPYDIYSNQMLAAVKKAGYQTILWSCDSMDWKNYSTDSIINTLCSHPQLANGAIIRLHTDAPHTVSALDELIIRLQETGYEIVPLSQLISP